MRVVSSSDPDRFITSAKNTEKLTSAYEHTRLVGLRTTKSCATSSKILSIQPIYFSINEEMC